jgi:hypothetical protein
MKRPYVPLLVTTWVLLFAYVVSAQINVPFTFTAGTIIDPDQMNTNFSTLGNAALNRSGGAMTGLLTTQHLVPATTNTYDIGTSPLQYRNLTLAGNISAGGVIASTGAITTTGGVTAYGSAMDAGNGYQIGGITVIDGARNITTIGTITSGAISSSGAISGAGFLTDGNMSASNVVSVGNGYQVNGLYVIDSARNIVNVNIAAPLINSGTMATARLGSGTANSTTYLRGDSTWVAIPTSTGPTIVNTPGLPYTANYNEFVLVTGTGTVTLPTAAGNSGKIVDVKNYGAGVITVASAGGSIDFTSTYTLAVQNQSVTVISDGGNWWIR